MIHQTESPIRHFLTNQKACDFASSETVVKRVLLFPEFVEWEAKATNSASASPGTCLVLMSPSHGAVNSENWIIYSSETATGSFLSSEQGATWKIDANDIINVPSRSPISATFKNNILVRVCGAELQYRFPGMPLIEYKGQAQQMQSWLPNQGVQDLGEIIASNRRPQNINRVAVQNYIGKWISQVWHGQVYTSGAQSIPSVLPSPNRTTNFDYYMGPFLPGQEVYDGSPIKYGIGTRFWGLPASQDIQLRAISWYSVGGDYDQLNVFARPARIADPDLTRDEGAWFEHRTGFHPSLVDADGFAVPHVNEVKEGLAAVANGQRPLGSARRIAAADVSLPDTGHFEVNHEPTSSSSSKFADVSNTVGQVLDALPDGAKQTAADSAKGFLDSIMGEGAGEIAEQILPVAAALL